MKCPKCAAAMTLYEGLDEKSDGSRMAFMNWECPTSVDHTIHDWEDDFEWPQEEKP